MWNCQINRGKVIEMVWKGFLTESKFYMSYPGYKREGILYCPGDYRPPMSDESWETQRPERKKRKVKFWLAFPQAAFKFYYYMLRDWYYRTLNQPRED